MSIQCHPRPASCVAGFIAIVSLCSGLIAAAPLPAGTPELPKGAVRSYGHVPMRHPAMITHADMSADGTRAVTLAADGQLRLWDVETGKLIVQRAQRRETVGSIHLSCDGQSVVVLDHSQGLNLYTGENLQTHRALGRGFQVSMSPTRPDRLAAVRMSQQVSLEIVDTTTGKTVQKLESSGDIPAGIALQSDGSTIVLRQQGNVVWYDPQGKNVGQAQFPSNGQPHQPARLSALGNRAVVIENNRRVVIYEIPRQHTGKFPEGMKLTEMTNGGSVFGVSPDGRFVLLYNGRGGMEVWDIDQKRDITAEARIPTTLNYGVPALVFSRDGKRASVGTFTEVLQVLDTAKWKPAFPTEGHSAAVRKVQPTPDGRRMVTSAADGTVRVWDRSSGKQVRVIDDAAISPTAFGLGDEGRLLATIRRDGRLVVEPIDGAADASARQEYAVFGASANAGAAPAASDAANAAAEVRRSSTTASGRRSGAAVTASCDVSPDGRYAAVLSNATLHLFDLRQKRAAGTFELRNRAGTARIWLSHGARSIACWSAGQFAVFALPSAGEAAPATRPTSIEPLLSTTVPGSPDAGGMVPGAGWDMLLTTANASDLRVVEAFSGLEPLSLKAAATGKKPEAVPPQQQAIIFAQQQALAARGGGGNGLAVLGDGRLFASCVGTDLRIRLWDPRSGQLLQATEASPAKVVSMAFADEGRALIAGGGDGSVIEWAVPADVLAKTRRAEPANSQELDSAVESLSSTKPTEAYGAILRIGDTGEPAVAPLRGAAAAPRMDPEEYQRLIAMLDSDTFADRERAEKLLVAAGTVAVPLLRQTLSTTSSMELFNRVPSILSRIQKNEKTSPMLLQRLRAVQVLETIGSPAALEALKACQSPEQPPAVNNRIQLAIDRLNARGGR